MFKITHNRALLENIMSDNTQCMKKILPCVCMIHGRNELGEQKRGVKSRI
jgi:hypothetical protein